MKRMAITERLADLGGAKWDIHRRARTLAAEGKDVWGTCAGMIMLAHEITEADPVPLQMMDIGVRRNAFGRQIDSFEQDLDIAGLEPDPFHAIFIRAPVVIRVGQQVKTLAALPNGQAVAVRQGNLMATAFHPELTDDTRLHQYFLDLAADPTGRPSRER